MICSSCQRSNLAGGVRCVYCGDPLPLLPDFDLGGTAPRPEPSHSAPGRAPVGLLAGLLLILVKGKSLLALFSAGKLATMLITMAVAYKGYAWLWGWKFALGFVISILIHELGHVAVALRHGIKASAPMFIPFAGALITVKELPDDPTIESELGAGGPAAGFAFALLCAALSAALGSQLLAGVATAGFAINLINLAPFHPLDGARIAALFSRTNWTVVLLVLLLYALKDPFPTLWPIIVVGIFVRLGLPPNGRHNLATPLGRMRMVGLYLFLCLSLTYSFEHLGDRRAAWGDIPQPQPVTPVETPRQPHTPPAWVVVAVVGVPLLIAFGLSTALPLLLRTGSKSQLRWQDFALSAAALAALAAVLVGLRSEWLPGAHWPWIAAWYAALLCAVLFAAQHAFHPTSAAAYEELRANALGWAAGGCLLVAYSADHLWLALATLGAVALFYALRPYLLLALLARGLDQLGAASRADGLRRRALSLHPPTSVSTRITSALIASHLAMDCGEKALQALDHDYDARRPVKELLRARSLILLGRYADALQACEAVLQESGKAGLVVVRSVLARMALQREWWDEAAAQSDAMLWDNTIRGSAELVANAHLFKATSLARQGRLEEARQQCVLAQRWTQETRCLAQVCMVRSEIGLQTSDLQLAERESLSALRRLPECLSAQYHHATVLERLGRHDEAGRLLTAMRDAHPADWFGQQAEQLRKSA